MTNDRTGRPVNHDESSALNDQDSLQFEFDCANVTWQQFVEIFKTANLEGREGKKIHRAFESSTVVCIARVAGRLVGAARALSDGEYHATIYDVAVHPDYQAKV